MLLSGCEKMTCSLSNLVSELLYAFPNTATSHSSQEARPRFSERPSVVVVRIETSSLKACFWFR